MNYPDERAAKLKSATGEIKLNQAVPFAIGYDLFCDLAGGISLNDVEKKYRKKYEQSIQEDTLAWLSTILGEEASQYFFKKNSETHFATEIFYLKTKTFLELINTVKVFYQIHRRPHLCINSITTLVDISGKNGPVPARWDFSVKLLHSFAASPDNIPEGWVKEKLLKPGGMKENFYLPPKVIATPFEAEYKLDSKITNIQIRESAEEKIIVINMQLTFKVSKKLFYEKGDLVRIFLNFNHPELEVQDFWGEIMETSGEIFEIRGEIKHFDENLKKILQSRVMGSTFFDTKVIIYKAYNISWDLYSLGKLLIGSLLTNEILSLEKVDEVSCAIIAILEESSSAYGTNPVYLKNRLLTKFKEYEEVFSKKNIFYYKKERELYTNRIPDEIWDEILIIAFKLMTDIKGFSFNMADTETNSTYQNSFSVLSECVSKISGMLYIDLFHREQMQSDISELFLNILNNQ